MESSEEESERATNVFSTLQIVVATWLMTPLAGMVLLAINLWRHQYHVASLVWIPLLAVVWLALSALLLSNYQGVFFSVTYIAVMFAVLFVSTDLPASDRTASWWSVLLVCLPVSAVVIALLVAFESNN